MQSGERCNGGLAAILECQLRCQRGKLTGFHAPQEAARILGESIDFSRKGQIALRDGKGESRSQTVKP